MLQEEALLIKEQLANPALEGFHASYGWLESFKKIHGIREYRICGEGDDVPIVTVKAWLERLPDIIKDYESCNQWNMDELGLFFEALLDKGLVQKKKSSKGGKKSKKRVTVAVFVAVDGSKAYDPVVTWPSKVPHCFRKLISKTLPAGLHYFSNAKSWMTTDIMEVILGRLDRQLKQENRHVLLFLDNAPCHPEALQQSLSFIKLVFLPKNTTSKLQPADAGIIRNLNAKYRKRLLRHVVSLLDRENTASAIIKSATVLDANKCFKLSWDEVNENTLRNCFQKCAFSQLENTTEVAQDDAEFEGLLQLLTTVVAEEDYLSFDDSRTGYKHSTGGLA